MKRLTILFEDDYFVAVHKPAKMFVHRSKLGADRVFVLQLLRNQLGRRIYPVHRLDRATSGALIFGKTPETSGSLCELFRERRVEKEYLAVVRGFVDERGEIDKPVREDPSANPKPAITAYHCLARAELPVPVGRYAGARYSLISAKPETGRRHQIRKHFSSAAHPIIGDKLYGDRHHNRMFRDHLRIDRLFLMSRRITFMHPYEDCRVEVEAYPDEEWLALFEVLAWPEPAKTTAGCAHDGC